MLTAMNREHLLYDKFVTNSARIALNPPVRLRLGGIRNDGDAALGLGGIRNDGNAALRLRGIRNNRHTTLRFRRVRNNGDAARVGNRDIGYCDCKEGYHK
jgi:hypothetical protein